MTLSELGVQQTATVTAVKLDAASASWLAAVGVAVGTELTVLRRALFGGPLHVRSGDGGEFAVARALATQIHIEEPEDG